MKTNIKKLFLLPARIGALKLIPPGRGKAQTSTSLYSFKATSTNSSGVYTTNLVSPAIWSTNSPAPIVKGQNTVTNPISGTQ